MIGILAPNVILRPRVEAPAPGTRLRSVALCGECGTPAASPVAGACIRTDCGLVDRRSHKAFV